MRPLVSICGLVLLLCSSVTRATVTISPATGGTAISADTAVSGGSGAWTILGPITIAESAKQDFSQGSGLTLMLKAPAGFEFNASLTPSASFLTGQDIQSASATFVDGTTLRVTFTVADRVSKDSLTVGATGLQVRPTQGTPLITGRHIYRPTSGGGTAVISGITASSSGASGSNFGSLTEVAGAFSRLLILLPGETAAPGTPTGKTGTALPQTNGLPFEIVVSAADRFWNPAPSSDTVAVTCSDPKALLPAAANLLDGAQRFAATLRSPGEHTLSATNWTNPSILPGNGTVQVLLSELRGGPVVAIHDSELTRALLLSNAAPTTPSGPGTTGKEWWMTNWNYFVMPESLQEALRADGTIFQVVTDDDIANGRLLQSNGKPRFPIVFSLASEAIADEAIGPLTNYVAAGGFLFVGSSSFTRNPNGTARGNFAFATEMGVQCASPGLTNWTINTQFGKLTEHRLTSHIPAGVLYWEMPSAADEIPWGRYPHPSNPYPGSPVWRVTPTTASVLASGNTTPLLLEKPYGAGRMLYYAPMQPIMGHGGWSPGTYAYLLFRNAIGWAFESSKMPVVRLSPWPYAFDAAFMARHDLENYQSAIAGIESFARFENAHGAKGSYFFVTGTLREDMSPAYDTNAVVAAMRRAVSNYSAVVGPHNGGLRNPYNSPPLSKLDYDYWHWGPDESLDIIPNGYSSGKEYALLSVSNAFADVESWLGTLSPPHRRCWVSPYFNSIREDSMDILAQLNVKTTGEKKLGFFPHWTLSSGVSDKRYGTLSIPVSDWFVGSTVSQSIEAGHTLESLRSGIDFYYQQGALINFYGHLLNTNGLQGEYVRYGMDTNLHPRVWPVNSLNLYDWWSQRSVVSILATHYATNSNEVVTTLAISDSTNDTVATEVAFPGSSTLAALQVRTNGVLATTDQAYRLDGLRLKVLVGRSVTNVQISYHLDPKAFPDTYALTSGPLLQVPSPGVLVNDLAGPSGGALTALLETPPTNGLVVLSTNGGFTYTPSNSFSGIDTFTYHIGDGVTVSPPAAVTLTAQAPGFSDDFTRPGGASLSPWVVRSGNWAISGGELLDGVNTASSYATIYYPATWTDYAVSASLRFEAGAFGGGVGGRVNASTGARYAAWLYPGGSSGGSNVVKLIKFQNWTSWTLLQQTSVPDVGTNWHTLKLAFIGNRLAGWLDGNPVLNYTDVSLPLASGGVSLGNWTASVPEVLRFDDVVVGPLLLDDNYQVVVGGALEAPAPGVLGNDSNPLGGALAAELVRGPASGSLTFNANGSFSYLPNSGFAGTDRFIYRAGVESTNVGSAWVNITVGAPNPPPQIQSIRVAQNAAEIAWSSVPGRTYRLQFSDSLSPAAWSNAVPDLLALGPSLSTTNLLGTASQRFYRVMLLP